MRSYNKKNLHAIKLFSFLGEKAKAQTLVLNLEMVPSAWD